jgi:putative photosynthetic complex assembly protein
MLEPMSAPHTPTKNLLPGVLAGGLLAITMGLVLWSKLSPPVPLVAPASQEAVIWQRELLFADGPKGEVMVKDFKTGEVIGLFEGEQGFVRGTLRALIRERKRRDVGSEQPFELIARAHGRLILNDPATAQRIDLDSFGPSNAALFRNLKADVPSASLSSRSAS